MWHTTHAQERHLRHLVEFAGCWRRRRVWWWCCCCCCGAIRKTFPLRKTPPRSSATPPSNHPTRHPPQDSIRRHLGESGRQAIAEMTLITRARAQTRRQRLSEHILVFASDEQHWRACWVTIVIDTYSRANPGQIAVKPLGPVAELSQAAAAARFCYIKAFCLSPSPGDTA